MRTTVRKWGNSLGLRIPRKYASEVRLDSGMAVDIAVRKGALVVRPVGRPAYRLSELLAKVTRTNLHPEVDPGEPVGREALRTG